MLNASKVMILTSVATRAAAITTTANGVKL